MKIFFSRLSVAALLTITFSSQAQTHAADRGPAGAAAAAPHVALASAASGQPATGILSAPLLLRRCEEVVNEINARVFDSKSRRSWAGRCYAFHDSVFAQVADSYQETSVRMGANIEWSLLRFDNQGGQTRLTVGTGAPGIASDTELKLRDEFKRDTQSAIEVIQMFDFDADGRPEFMIEHRTWKVPPWGLQSQDIDIWTLNGDVLVPYGQAPRALGSKTPVLGSVEDVDSDGRPDISTSGPYASARWFSCARKSAVPLVSEVFVLHSQPDGTFSDSDAVAQELLKKKWCPEKPDLGALVVAARGIRPGGIPSHAELVHAVVCARVWGESAQAVLTLLAPACPKLAESDCPDVAPRRSPSCPQWLQNLVSIRPPFELR